MRKKRSILIYPLLIMGVFLIFAGSCKKDDKNDNGVNNAGKPVLTTATVTDITQTTAISGGNITSDGGATVTARGVCWSTGQAPTISDNKTTDGSGAGNFVSSISGLSANTTYYVRAYATNSNGTGYGSAISFTTKQGTSAGSFTDTRDGNVYQTVTIGNQVWMAENLKWLPSVVGPTTGTYTEPEQYYYVYGYDGTDVNAAKATANYTTYGVLYNWYAAMNGEASSTTNPSGVQGVCPAGWHLPSYAEWTELADYLGGVGDAGGKLKATGTIEAGTGLWYAPNSGATNETGFTALPGGYRYSNGTFLGLGEHGYWWSATGEDSYFAWSWYMYYYNEDANGFNFVNDVGFSVRCVKD